MSNLCKYCGGTLPTLYEGQKDIYTISKYIWKCPVCGRINVKGDDEK